MTISDVDAVSGVSGAYRVYFHLNSRASASPINKTQNISPNLVEKSPRRWSIDSFYSIYNFLINNQGIDKSKEVENKPKEECHSCQGRRYICSNGETSDGISTVIPGRQSELRIQHHEAQHLHQARIRAAQEGKVIISQHIHLQHAICPECGGTYVSGGQALTQTLNKENFQKLIQGTKPTYQSSGKINDLKPEGKGINVDFYG